CSSGAPVRAGDVERSLVVALVNGGRPELSGVEGVGDGAVEGDRGGYGVDVLGERGEGGCGAGVVGAPVLHHVVEVIGSELPDKLSPPVAEHCDGALDFLGAPAGGGVHVSVCEGGEDLVCRAALPVVVLVDRGTGGGGRLGGKAVLGLDGERGLGRGLGQQGRAVAILAAGDELVIALGGVFVEGGLAAHDWFSNVSA